MRIVGLEKERIDTIEIINTAWKKYIGELPQANNPLHVKFALFKRMVTEEIEKEQLVWETRIRKEYETSPHWKYIKNPQTEHKFDIQGYEKG